MTTLGDRTIGMRDWLASGVMATASLHSAAADLGEAKAIETACAHVLRILEWQTARAVAQAAKPKAV